MADISATSPVIQNSLKVRQVYGFGETVFDIIFKEGDPVAARPGGSVLNSFVSLGRLGWSPNFISEYGTDDVGDIIDKYLTDNGVLTDCVNRFRTGQSAIALAFLDSGNNAVYSFYKNFPDKRLQELPDGIRKDDIILFGSIYASNSVVRESVMKLLETGRERGALILYDPNFRRNHQAELGELKPRIIENIEYSDIIRGSEEDFRLIFGIRDPDEIPRHFNIGSKILICTRSREAVRAYAGGTSLEMPVEQITPVSTIGAGDNFNAGIIHYLLSKGITREQAIDPDPRDVKEMIRTGIRFATHVCFSYDNHISVDFAASESV